MCTKRALNVYDSYEMFEYTEFSLMIETIRLIQSNLRKYWSILDLALKMALHLKLEEKDLVARATIFSLLSSQMFRCVCMCVCAYTLIFAKDYENTIPNVFNCICYNQPGWHADCKGRDIWSSTNHIEIQVRSMSLICREWYFLILNIFSSSKTPFIKCSLYSNFSIV